MDRDYKAYTERAIIDYCRIKTEESEFKGFFPKEWAIQTISYFTFETVGWNKKLDKFATKFTVSEDYDIRYYLRKSFDEQEVRAEDLMTEEEILPLCEKILNKMVEKGILEFSKSGKALKYVNN